MRVIKIDVEKKEIYEVDYSGNFYDIYTLIGNGCSCFTCPIVYENEDGLMADDEILLRPNDIKGAFIYPDWHSPIANNAVIVGADEDGDPVDAKSSIEEIEKGIKWISLIDLINYAHG